MRPSASAPEPLTRVIEFAYGGQAIVTSFDEATTVNWSAGVGARDFVDQAISIMRVDQDAEVTTQVNGEDMRDASLGELLFGADRFESLDFVRVDLSDTKSIAWQRLDPGTVFAGIGEATARFSADELAQLITQTSASTVRTDQIMLAVGEVVTRSVSDLRINLRDNPEPFSST